MNFDLSPEDRQQAWDYLLEELEQYYAQTRSLPVAPRLDIEAIRSLAARHDFSQPLELKQALGHVLEGLRKYAVHTPHPGYFGLFNPRAHFPGILADTLVATFNPQMAAWSHAPFAAEVEQYLLKAFGKRFGFQEAQTDGVFTSGGAEANQTAVLAALSHHFPAYANEGLWSLERRPVLYTSAQSHHSVGKAARVAGLGMDAVRQVAVDGQQRMRGEDLRFQLKRDLEDGFQPFLVVATAGSTGTGAIDPLLEIAEIAREHGLWMHVDAAYGGALSLVPEKKHLLAGIEQAHSITFDAHKWLSTPMAAGMFLTRKPEILGRTFRITTEYMPKEGRELPVVDPFTHSMQWSRRFTGLKVYLGLLVFGWEGYAETLRYQIGIGQKLKEQLLQRDWKVYNQTALPIACFADPSEEKDTGFVRKVCDRVLASGKAWISLYPVAGVQTLRACITNYATTEEDLDILVEQLDKAREEALR